MSICNFDIYQKIWVKFGMRNLAITLLSICDFHENRQRDGRTFLIGVTEITLMCVP